MNHSFFLRCVCLMAVTLLTTPLRAQTDYFWSGASNTNFFDSANWVGGVRPTNSLASRVNFTAASYSNQPFWNTNGWNLNGFVFGDGTNASGAVTLRATSGFVLLNSGGITMNSNAGAVTFDTTGTFWARIAANQTWLNNSTNTLYNKGSLINGAGGANVTLTLAGTGRIVLDFMNQTTGNVFKVVSMSGNGVVAFGLSDTTTLTTLNSGRVELNADTSLGTGGLTINGGTLSTSAAGGVNLSGNNAITINNNFTYGSATTTNRTMNLGGGAVTLGASATIDTFSGDLQIGGAIGDGGNGRGITKTGAGTLTLAGANTYTGATTISAGSLIIGSSGSVASSSVLDVANGAILNVSAVSGGFVVGAGQSLRGSGTVVGNTTINGSLQPGSSPGLLSFNNDLTLGNTAVVTMEINGAGTRGTAFDAVNVGSLLTYDGALTLSIGTTFAEGNYSFDLFDFGSQAGSFDSVALGGSYSGSLTDNGLGVWGLTSGAETWTFYEDTGVLDLGVVPEPSTYALLALAAAGIFGFSRFSKRAGNHRSKPGDLQ